MFIASSRTYYCKQNEYDEHQAPKFIDFRNSLLINNIDNTAVNPITNAVAG